MLDGRAAPGLLATYDEERRPNAVAAIDFSIELGKVICVPDPAEAAARDEAMAAGYDGSVSDVPGLPGIDRGLDRRRPPLAGELFPQGDLGGRWFDDVHGVGWRLVTVDPDAPALDAGLVEWLAGIGGAVVAVPDEASGPRRLVRRPTTCAWALQRPDFHLFGTAADASGAADLLTELQTQLA